MMFDFSHKNVKGIIKNIIPIPKGFVIIPGFDNYMIDKHGSIIRICNDGDWKGVCGFVNAHGYVKVGLRKNNKTYHTSVHKLVAMLFIPNPNNYPIINHKDENKTNNDYTNLEWCTVQYNNTYKNANNKYINKRKKVVCYDIINNIEIHYKSLYDCSISMNINSGTIWERIKVNRLLYKRYLFKYE